MGHHHPSSYCRNCFLFLAANNPTECASMGVMRFLFLFLVLPSPLFAQTPLEQAYRMCVQDNNPFACQRLIFEDGLATQQRDTVRQRLEPWYVSRMLDYLQHDGPGFLTLEPSYPHLDTSFVQNFYRMCIQQDNKYSCRNLIRDDLITAEQRRNVHQKLDRLDPGYVDDLVRFLSPTAVIAASPPPPAPPLPAASPTPPSASSSPAFDKPVRTPMAEAELAFQNFMWWVGTAFEVVFALIALIVIFFLYLKFSRKSEEHSAWANLPVEGPMKVNIEEQYVEAGSFNSKHVPCGLKIDVKISQNDWRVIANAGLMKKVLFHGDGPSGAQYDPENTRPWLVEDLKTSTYASFWDVQRMYDAKEELIKSLVNLRAAVEAQKEGPQVTSFEI
jgi:hypothetical protein